MKLEIACLASAAFVAVAGPARAQTSAGEGAGGQTEYSGLQEIVVTAQRQSQSLQEVPIAINAVTADDLARRQINNSLSLEAAVPNLTLPQNGVSVTPFLRGVGSSQSNPNDEASVATYIDGVYIPSVTGNIFSFNNVERIEVLKGPQGTLFGRNATGGVIQIVTKDPSLEHMVFDASLGAGNHGIMEGRSYLSAPLSSSAAVDLSAVYDHVDGFGKDINRHQDIFEKDQVGVRSKLYLVPGENTEIRIAGDYSRLDSTGADYQLSQGVIGIDGVTGYPGERKTNTDYANRGDNETYGASVRIDQDLQVARLASISAYRHVDGVFGLDQDATPTPVVRANINQFAESYSQELQLFAARGSKVDWLLGGFFFDAKYAYDPLTIAGAAAAPLPSIDLFGEQQTRSYSGYGQATVPVTETTHVTGGLRWTDERQTTDGYSASGGFVFPHAANPLCPGATTRCPQEQSFNKLTWRISIDQELSDDILGYVSYNRGIKSGGFNMINAGTPGYDPEILDAYELGLKMQLFDHRVRLNAAAFFYDYKDIQVFNITGGGAVLTTNAAAAQVYGLDADLTFLVTSNLTISAGLGLLDSEYTSFPDAVFTPPSPLDGPATIGDADGNRTVFAPKVSSNLSVDYRVPTSSGEFGLNLSLSQRDEVFVSPDNRLSIPGYTVVNSVLSWTSNSGQTGVQLWARNLFDEDYYLNRTEQAFGDIQYLAPPRTVGITVSFKTQ